ncbi:phytanoyl-CoA dioxygenase [bacterium]|nr:MAG: phytanoyl-CoA dioxygenase [bacterium]
MTTTTRAPFRFGEAQFEWGEEVFALQDSSPLVHDGNFDALRARLQNDGFLFIRGFHPRNLAQKAEAWVLEAIRERGGLNADGTISDKNLTFAFFRDTAISHAPEILALTDGGHTFSFYEQLLGGDVLTFDKRWLRAMAQGGNNGFHYDKVYVGRGTPNKLTMWSAISDIPLERGPLVMALGSHQDERLKSTYGATDVDRDAADPVFSTDPREIVDYFGFKLGTTNFEPGDVLIFPMLSMHSSAPNLDNYYRISIDTRYQLASEETDPRFFGENGTWQGNFANKDRPITPIAELKKQWGL